MDKFVKLIDLPGWKVSPSPPPLVADRDALLILRESYFRVRLFESFLDRLQMSSSLLEEKLCRLVEDGMLRRIPRLGQSNRCEYVLTSSGFDFLPVALSILRLHRGDVTSQNWHERQNPSADGTVFDGILICRDCGEVLAREIVRPLPRGRQKGRANRQNAHHPAILPYCDVPLVQ
jgi:DNA-binding HxlR family transcriptional regulator